MSIFQNIRTSLQRIKNKFSKKGNILLALILSVVALVVFCSALKSVQGKTEDSSNKDNKTESMQDFISNTECRLENILQSIKGVGDVSVFIMASQSSEFVYITDDEINKTQSAGNSTESITASVVTIKNGNDSAPVLKMEIYPKITGVLIVAEGAGDEKRRLMILNAVAVALDIENSKIEVLAAEKSK